MNMAIGFGSTEKAFEDAEESAFVAYVEQRWTETGAEYFSTDLVKDVDRWMKDRADATQASEKLYGAADTYPDRYSYFWAHIIADGFVIVARMTFHHVNRRHGLSPDGWGLLVNKRLFDIDVLDVRDRAASRSDLTHQQAKEAV